jgi:uncharacterized ubiquitin-like protein YukD
MWRTKKLEIPVPSFGHLSDLFASIPVKVQQFCDKLSKRVANGESVAVIMDSTGFRFGKASHWYETKYAKPCKQRPWRKLHISMDPDMNIYDAEVTDLETSDIAMIEALLPGHEYQDIEKLIADGAYYSINGVESLMNKGIIPAIPPPSNAVIHGRVDTTWHDTVVQYIKDKGSVYAFHKKVGYGCRALVESQMSRIKRCIGISLKTQKIESQKREGKIIANIINKWNSFGKCIAVKVG